MKRLTTNDTNHILALLNMFYAEDNEVMVRGGGPEPDYADTTLVELIRRIANTHNLTIAAEDAESLGDEMYDAMFDGVDTVEGVVGLLHAAAVQAAEMRGRLEMIEDILGGDYNLDRLRELAEADRKGRCVVTELAPGDEVWVVERDEDGNPDDFSGYIFITSVRGIAIVSPSINGCADLDFLLRDFVEETAMSGSGDFSGYPIGDCYGTYEEAKAALREAEG